MKTKQFFIKFVIFLVLFLVVNYFVDRMYKKSKNAVCYTSDRQFLELKTPPDILILGDSYLQDGVNPEHLGNCFNYASVLENYEFTVYKLRYILKHLKNPPKLILLSADPCTFSSLRNSKQQNDSYWIRFVDYFEMARKSGDRRYYTRWLIGNFFSYCGGYHSVFRMYERNNEEEIETASIKNGYKPWTTEFSKFREKRRIAMSVERARAYFAGQIIPDPEQSIYLGELLSMIDQTQTKVVILKMPATREFLEATKKYVDFKKLDAKIDEIVGNHPSVVSVLNYREIFPAHPEFFHNPDHMNSKGAKVLSKKLAEDLKPILNW